MIWKILEIEKTKDEEVIRNAYREKLRFVNPEDDQQGFMELRQAYEEALAYAKRPETEEEVDGTEPEFKGKKNDVDLWIDKVDIIYCDVKTRIQEDKNASSRMMAAMQKVALLMVCTQLYFLPCSKRVSISSSLLISDSASFLARFISSAKRQFSGMVAMAMQLAKSEESLAMRRMM